MKSVGKLWPQKVLFNLKKLWVKKINYDQRLYFADLLRPSFNILHLILFSNKILILINILGICQVLLYIYILIYINKQTTNFITFMFGSSIDTDSYHVIVVYIHEK